MTLTDKLSQIRGKLQQNARICGNGSNSRILRVPLPPWKI